MRPVVGIGRLRMNSGEFGGGSKSVSVAEGGCGCNGDVGRGVDEEGARPPMVLVRVSWRVWR